jgi:hypothetical protein
MNHTLIIDNAAADILGRISRENQSPSKDALDSLITERAVTWAMHATDGDVFDPEYLDIRDAIAERVWRVV